MKGAERAEEGVEFTYHSRFLGNTEAWKHLCVRGSITKHSRAFANRGGMNVVLGA